MSDQVLLYAYFTVIGLLSLFGLHRYLMIFLYYRYRRHVPTPLSRYDEQDLPRITLQLPVYNELYVGERLLDAVARLDYPNNKLQVQVLDDSTDETTVLLREKVAGLRSAGLDIELLHREVRTGFKAGALEEALPLARGELVAILDADFVPPPAFLRDCVDYFTDPGIAVVQTCWGHLNRESSLLTELQSVFLDGHLVLEQTARHRSGRYFNFNGTAGIWRKAVIADAGGWQHDTLTEDIDLSYRAQMRGWRFVFLKDVVTPAELPPDIHAFKNQQHRWTKGMIQVARKMIGPLLTTPGIPLRCRVEGVSHLLMGVSYPLMILLVLLLKPVVQLRFETTLQELLWVDLPLFLAATVSVFIFYLVSQLEAHGRAGWRCVGYLPALVALGVGMVVSNTRAWLEGLFGHVSEFVRTPKYSLVGHGGSWQAKRYKGATNTLQALLELTLGTYCLLPLIAAIQEGRWLVAPFLLLFVAGFYGVGLASLPVWSLRANAQAAPAPALDLQLESGVDECVALPAPLRLTNDMSAPAAPMAVR